MTNTLHRQGTHESLSRDYIIFLHPARGVNRAGSSEKTKRFLRLALEENPVNMGAAGQNLLLAGDPEALINSLSDEDTTVAVTFDNLEALQRFVAKVKEADFGISVNISGLADEVDAMLRSEGIVRHSIEHSLGILGRPEKLPTEQVLEITTMCGHGLVSANHARKMIDLVKLGKLTPRKAAYYLGRPCICGAFNVARAEELLVKAIDMA